MVSFSRRKFSVEYYRHLVILRRVWHLDSPVWYEERCVADGLGKFCRFKNGKSTRPLLGPNTFLCDYTSDHWPPLIHHQNTQSNFVCLMPDVSIIQRSFQAKDFNPFFYPPDSFKVPSTQHFSFQVCFTPRLAPTRFPTLHSGGYSGKTILRQHVTFAVVIYS